MITCTSLLFDPEKRVRSLTLVSCVAQKKRATDEGNPEQSELVDDGEGTTTVCV